MLKIIYTTVIILNISTTHGSEICTYMTNITSSSSLEKFITDCSVQKKFASDPEVESLHRNKIHAKLAEKLAKQIEQNSEEMAVLANYFDMNGNDLLMNNEDVAKECTLKKVQEIEKCSGSIKSKFYDEKMRLLKNSFHKNKTHFSKDNSLYGILAGKFTADIAGEESSCPVNSKSGSFLLRSQIDDKAATAIIEALSNDSSVSSDDLFKEYAQLKFIQNSDTLVKELRTYLKNKPANIKASKYLSNFFTNPKNHNKLSPVLLNQCKRMNENISRYLCSDLNELGSLDDEISRDLFSKLSTEDSLDNQYEVNLSDPSVLTAYGMQCLAKDKIKTKSNKVAENENTLDNWYKKFTSNTRTYEATGAEAAEKVGEFCNLYECKNEKIKQAQSCRNGGPVTSSDIWAIFNCEKGASECDPFISKYHTMLQSLEKIKGTSSQPGLTQLSTRTSNNVGRQGRLPSFAENYLGIEGSLKALGRPVTAEAVAEKTREHEERVKLEEKKVAMKAEEAPISAPVLKQKEQEVVETPSAQDEASSANEKAKNEYAANRTYSDSTSPSKSTDKKTEEKRSAIIAKNEDSDSLKETKRIREEMEQIIAGMKGAGHDTSALEQDLNDVSAMANRKSALGSSSSYNRAEEERLKRWDQTLKDKSRDLDQYRRELDDRNFAERNPTRDESSRAPGAAPGNAGKTAASDAVDRENSSSGAAISGGSSGGIRLSANNSSGVKGEQKPETAAIIQAGKESSTMTTDELVKLSPENLKQFGIDASKPFTLRVNFNNKTYDIPVKNFSYKGNVILGPIIDKKNKELNEFLLKSPLFKEYYNYQMLKESSAL